MSVPIRQVDAFTAEPFAGNPAGVCLLHHWPEDSWLAAVAAEMNLSETAFLVPREDGSWHLRWFTPTVEVDLCGHATLASAHVLWDDGLLRPDAPARFDTRSGLLVAERRGDLIRLDLPAEPLAPLEPSAALLAAVGARVSWAGEGQTNVLVELESEAAVRALEPDLRWLRTGLRDGLIVTARSDDPAFDVVSRYFCPAAGIDEDPVTGSAHCALGPYWAARLGRPVLRAFQASRRGGVLEVEPLGDRVAVSGRAVTVLRGELLG